MPKPQPEPGAAQIQIRLKDSTITVRHTNESGEILFERKAVKGDWDKLWKTIRGGKTNSLSIKK